MESHEGTTPGERRPDARLRALHGALDEEQGGVHARNAEALAQRSSEGTTRTCLNHMHRELILSMTRQAMRLSDASDVFRHLRARTLVLVTDPGPDVYDVIALLMAASLHLQGRVVLAAVICNGGGVDPKTGTPLAVRRAALARVLLDYFNLYDVPVGVGSPTMVEARDFVSPLAYQFDFPGFDSVAAEAHLFADGQTLLVDTLRRVEGRSVTFVIASALSDLALLVRSYPDLVRDKTECVSIMGGVACNDQGMVAAQDKAPYLQPDRAGNNQQDQDAASAVYTWCVEQRVPLRVVSRLAVPSIPLRVVRTLATNHPHDPVIRYLGASSELGLVDLWKKVCQGRIPRGKRWFFSTFCGISSAEFDEIQGEQLGENFPIGNLLDGTSKAYDVVALLLALHDPGDTGQGLFPFDQAHLRLNGADHYFFVQPQHIVPAPKVLDHLSLLYQFVIGLGKWSFRARVQQAGRMVRGVAGGMRHQVSQGHSGWVMSIVPCYVDGRETVCTGSFDGSVRLWDEYTGRCTRVLKSEQSVLQIRTDSGGAGQAAEAAAAGTAQASAADRAGDGGATAGQGAAGPTSASDAQGTAPVTPALAQQVLAPTGAGGGGGGASSSDAAGDKGEGGHGLWRPSLLAREAAHGLARAMRCATDKVDGGVMPISCVAKSPAAARRPLSSIYYGLDNGDIRVWRVDGDSELDVITLRDERHQHPAQVSTILVLDGQEDDGQSTIASGPSLITAGGREKLLGQASNNIFQWDLQFGLVVARYVGHTGWVRCMAASSGYLFSGSCDGSIRRWRVQQTSARAEAEAMVVHADHFFTIWPERVESVEALQAFDPLRSSWIRGLAVSDDCRMLFSAGNDCTLRRWDGESGAAHGVYLDHSNKVTCVALPRGNSPLFVFSGSNDGFILQWSIATGQVIARIECRTAVTFIALSEDRPEGKPVTGAWLRSAWEYRTKLYSGHYDTTVLQWKTSVVIDDRGQLATRASRRRDMAELADVSAASLSQHLDAASPATDLEQGPRNGEASSSSQPPPVLQVGASSSNTLGGCNTAPPLSRAESETLSEVDLGGGMPTQRPGPVNRRFQSFRDSNAAQPAQPAIMTVPRSSAVRFTHMPISSVLTAMLDGPMVTISGIMYALAHPMWNATGWERLKAISDAVMFALDNVFSVSANAATGSANVTALSDKAGPGHDHLNLDKATSAVRTGTSAVEALGGGALAEGDAGADPRAYEQFVMLYWVMVFFAALSIVLFLTRAHERCVYALRNVATIFETDFDNKGATKVVYATKGGLALFYVERFLVYFIIFLGGGGFFMISRFLLKVIQCEAGRWKVNPAIQCGDPDHVFFMRVTLSIFPFYILIACRMSASYNDVTYLSEFEGSLPPSGQKLRQLFTFWGSTVVKRAGYWTRHPTHGWKFGLTGRLSILVNWIADLLISERDFAERNHLRWISVALWLVTAYVLIDFTFRYQPMAEPFSCKVLVVFRAIFASTYTALALVCAWRTAAAVDTTGPDWRSSSARHYSLASWVVATVVAVGAALYSADRHSWQCGNENLDVRPPRERPEPAQLIRRRLAPLAEQVRGGAPASPGSGRNSSPWTFNTVLDRLRPSPSETNLAAGGAGVAATGSPSHSASPMQCVAPSANAPGGKKAATSSRNATGGIELRALALVPRRSRLSRASGEEKRPLRVDASGEEDPLPLFTQVVTSNGHAQPRHHQSDATHAHPCSDTAPQVCQRRGLAHDAGSSGVGHFNSVDAEARMEPRGANDLPSGSPKPRAPHPAGCH